MDAYLRALVRERAGDRCEYCRLRQQDEPLLRFQVDHITALQHRGSDDLSNLALICTRCNWQKGPNIAGIDPDTNLMTRLFHPRQDTWDDHFWLEGPMILGKTAIGRTTIWVLTMNRDDRIELRSALLELGEEL